MDSNGIEGFRLCIFNSGVYQRTDLSHKPWLCFAREKLTNAAGFVYRNSAPLPAPPPAESVCVEVKETEELSSSHAHFSAGDRL